jgi:fucose 4-O-acetylase-like acetyltransferase
MPKNTPKQVSISVGTAAAGPLRREQWIDVAKGLSIAAVVLFHVGTVVPASTPAGRVWTLIDLGLFTFIMPLFFLVSGLFVGRSLTLPLGQFIKVKVWPYAYLFLVWIAIFAALHAATGGLLGNSLADSLLLRTILWYMAALAGHMLVARLLNSVHPALVLSATALLAVPFALWLPFDGWGLAHTPHFLIFFLIGCRCKDWLIGFINQAGAARVAYILAVGATLGIVTGFVPNGQAAAYALAPVVAVPLILIASKWAARWTPLAVPVSALGRNTLPVFLLHPLILGLIGWAIKEEEITGPLQWPLPLLVTAATVAGSLVLWLCLRRIPGLFQLPTRG